MHSSQPPTQRPARLSPTEARILHEREKGASYKEISERFAMPVGTLRTHLHRIFVKTGAHNTAGAVWNLSH